MPAGGADGFIAKLPPAGVLTSIKILPYTRGQRTREDNFSQLRDEFSRSDSLDATAPGCCTLETLPSLSPRPARRGACWPLRERARPLRPPSHALQRARASAPLAANAPRAARSEARATRIWRTPGSRAERRPSAQPRIASMPTALPRRPKRALAVLIPFYAADARPAPPPPAPSQIQNNLSDALALSNYRL